MSYTTVRITPKKKEEKKRGKEIREQISERKKNTTKIIEKMIIGKGSGYIVLLPRIEWEL